MTRTFTRRCRPLSTMVAFSLLVAAPILAQDSSSPRGGIPEDWTYHHSVFANAGTAEQAIHNGSYDQWLKVVNDPRYQLQWAKRTAAAQAKTANLPEATADADSDAEAGDASAEVNDETRIAPDAPVRLPRGLTKAIVAPPSSGSHGAGPRPKFDRGSKHPPEWGKRHHNGEKVDWSETLGGGGSLGLGVFPAKYSFSTSTSACTDWVVYGTGLAGSTSQATILSFTNLYAGTCSGSVPNINWAFNTGTGSAILTSPVLSLDGTQLAFVQSSSTGVASLVVLKWSAGGTLAAPSPLSSQASASAYRSCTAPCMFSMTFSGGANDSESSAWYDYGLDTVWVGDDNGVLHKFTGIFAGQPAEVTSGGWPVTVSASPLNGPARDSVTGNVFVGDYALSADSPCTPSSISSPAPCGFLYSYNSSTGTLNAKSAQLDYNFGIVSTPVLDQYAGQLYVAVGSDGEIGTSTNCVSGPCAGIFQLPTSFSSGASGTEAKVGPGYEFLLTGAFDNAYLTSANASSPTGHMYVVGNTGPANNTLYQVSITANVMGTSSIAGPVVAQNYTNGSMYASGLDVTEFFNSGIDYIFLSTLGYSNYAGCGATPSASIGCVVGFDVTSGSISASTLPTGSSPAAGGASGIIVDNAGSAAGESNVYFSALSNQTCTTSGGSSGCAIQISQSAP